MRLIESNGLLIGFLKKDNYSECEIAFKSGDRFLLYTDGLTEAENTDSEAFGDRHLSEVIRSHENASAAELGANMLKELRLWQHTPISQQDDITWIIIDIK